MASKEPETAEEREEEDNTLEDRPSHDAELDGAAGTSVASGFRLSSPLLGEAGHAPSSLGDLAPDLSANPDLFDETPPHLEFPDIAPPGNPLLDGLRGDPNDNRTKAPPGLHIGNITIGGNVKLEPPTIVGTITVMNPQPKK